MPRRMKTNSNNIVIVCEGTDTEYLYFSELKDYVESNFPDRFCGIKVVPVPEELIRERNPRRSGLVRRMNNVPQYHYYCKFEKSAAEYEQYRAQPTRYVREAALFMQQDGYSEGWAVFDNDKHPAHEEAFRYASRDHVSIAFSSYSFEEWLLAHFERCPKAFHHSECKKMDKELHCGAKDAAEGDCRGENCIGGRLRMQGYIPDYSKNMKGIFARYTLFNYKKAMINAAWLRYRSAGRVLWESNPYTDVDELVASMLDEQSTFMWYAKDCLLKYANSNIEVKDVGGGFILLKNIGDITVIIREKENSFLDGNLNTIGNNNRILLKPCDSVEIKVPDNSVALILKNGECHYLIDLTN